MNQGRFSKVVSVLVTGIIAMSGLPCKVLADVINAPTYYSVQSGLEYEITTNVTSSWINHTSVDFVVSNTGDETIHNWYLTFNTSYVIDNIWNGALYETDGNGTYTITSNGWNQDIHPGETVTIGATFSSTEEEALTIAPEWYLLNTQATVVDSSLYTLDYIEYSSWESGFTGQLTLQPQVDCQHWSLTFTSNRDITAVSSAVLNTEDDSSYEITHDENNMRLFANNAYNFGIQGVNTEDPLEFANIELTVVDLAYHLTDDMDGNGTPDYLDFIGGGSVVGPTPTPTDAPTVSPTEGPTDTPTGEPSVTEQPTETPTEEPTETVTPTEEPTPTPDIDYDLDRDLDGLPDNIEDQIGTDPLKADTDYDELSDYIEVMIGYDPTNTDSDGNGVTDGLEDCDQDGLSNIYELSLGTAMLSEDTDSDELSDGEEISIYGTNPLVPDSDGDGIYDGDEVEIGKNPADSSDGSTRITQTVTQIINNIEDPSITTVDVTVSVANKIDRVVDVNDNYTIDVYSTAVYGRVGSPLEFECEEDFDTATVVIHYNEATLGDTAEENLGVLWLDEETGFYIIQDQAVLDTNTNTVTLELDHFSTYILVDLNKWNNRPIAPITPVNGEVRTVNYRTTGVIYDAFPIYETNSEGELVFTGRYSGGTIAPERNETNAWNQYLEYHPNDVRVETLNTGYYYLFGGLNYTYTWRVYTNVSMDDDNDQDGVPDYWEINGIYPLNGAVNEDGTPILYTSSVDETEGNDSDNDELSDLQEYGTVYIVSMDSDDGSISAISITTDGRESVPVDSKAYLRICAFVEPILGLGQTLAVCDLYSDPMSGDTDGDFYNDLIDPRPRRNGLITIDLGGNSFDVREHDNEGYIHVYDTPSEPDPAYGGDQGWFSDESLGIDRTGCGLIATNDVLMYLNYGVNEYPWNVYRNSVLSTYSDFEDAQRVFSLNSAIPNSFLVSPLFVQECLLYNGYFSSQYVIDQNIIAGAANVINFNIVSENLLDDIETSLRNNRPVILMEDDFIGYNRRQHNEPVVGLTMFQVDSAAVDIGNLFDSKYSMDYHYVTVTGMVIDRNADAEHRVYLRVQSWGDEYYINMYEFFAYNCESIPDSRSGRIIIVD